VLWLVACRKVKQQAEQQLEALAIRLNATETQLAALAAKRGLLQVRKLTDEGQKLLAQLDSLLNDNSEVIAGNPVRTVRELLETLGSKREQSTSRQRVEEFLAAKPVIEMDTPAEPVSIEQKPVKAKKRSARNKEGKPIFQQSLNESRIAASSHKPASRIGEAGLIFASLQSRWQPSATVRPDRGQHV